MRGEYMEKRRKSAALLPVGVFLIFYLGLGILFEYIMKIPMGFYNVPIVVAFLAALLVACLQNRKVGFDEKLEIMGRGIGDKNIITMLLIFLTAGTFVGVVGRSSAESVAYFMLSIIPARLPFSYQIDILGLMSAKHESACNPFNCRAFVRNTYTDFLHLTNIQ